HRLAFFPGGAGVRDVAGAVLRLPGEALTQRLDGAELREFLQHPALAGVPLALDELDDADLHAVADAAHHHAEGRRRLALALAGVDDEQALLDGLARHHLVARFLALGGFLVGAAVEFGFFGHEAARVDGVRPAQSLSRAWAALDLGRQRLRSCASSRRSAI